MLLGRFVFAAAVFCLVEAGVFHSGFYASILEPTSAAGQVETLIRNENTRQVQDRNQVLAVGDSRMGLLPRMANEERVGYTFASIALGGSTPRSWYYMLRDTDPTARRYAAVVIPMNDYDARDFLEDLSGRITDLYYLAARLRIADLAEFSRSFPTRQLQWTAVRGILLRGLVYKRDFQEFVQNPGKRWEDVKLYREGSAGWYYSFVPEAHSLEGLKVDWEKKKIEFPPGLTETQRQSIANVMLEAPAPQTGRYAAYLRHWLGKIVVHYRGSGTRLIFLRIPRGPLPRPETPPPFASPIRELAGVKDAVLLDEHRFDELERLELFGDARHLNAEGIRRFSKILAEETRRILGPPAAANAF
jgi:hypothetical protein